MAAWIFLPLAFAALPPEPTPTLTLVWHDSAHVFPAVGLDHLGDEMEALFRENGLSVSFHAASENEDLRTIPEPRVNAIVLPEEDRRFGLPPNTMAAAYGARGEKYSIFVFYPGVRRTLGHSESQLSPRHVAELSRALARIVAHEVVHALAPERGHADSGLMSGSLTREALLADAIDLDGPSLARASDALKGWGNRPPALTGSSKFPVPAAPLRSIVIPEVQPTCPFAR
jgi:hypothetical protein